MTHRREAYLAKRFTGTIDEGRAIIERLLPALQHLQAATDLYTDMGRERAPMALIRGLAEGYSTIDLDVAGPIIAKFPELKTEFNMKR